MRNYESEFGTKQSCSYEVRHFYKKLFFNPGIYFDQNPFPNNKNTGIKKSENDLPKDIQSLKITQGNNFALTCGILNEDISQEMTQ